MKRRWPDIEFHPNPLTWQWHTYRLDHGMVYRRGPFTITTYKGWAAWMAR